MMKKILILGLLLASGSVQAALFQGTTNGIFDNPTGVGSMVTTGVDTSNFTWGDGTPPSSLGFVGAAFDEDENDAFTFGTLNYFNGANQPGTTADAVDLSVELTFTSPAAFMEGFVFDLGLINTPNTSDQNASADIVNFDNTVPSNFFSFDGTDYTLEILGFGTLTGGGFTLENSFRVFEGDSATVELIGRITSTPSAVPVPSAVWLFGSALIGFVGMSRRRKVA
jgi:hypothetical protein